MPRMRRQLEANTVITHLRSTLAFPWKQLTMCDTKRRELHASLDMKLSLTITPNTLMIEVGGKYDSNMLDQFNVSAQEILPIARIPNEDDERNVERAAHAALDEVFNHCATGAALLEICVLSTTDVRQSPKTTAKPRGRKHGS